MVTGWALMVMPRSRSRSIESSNCSCMSRSEMVPVRWSKRSDSVVFPWSMWAMMLKLRMCAASIVQMRNAERGMRNLNHSDKTARIRTLGFLNFQPLQILGHESGYVLELGNVRRVDAHQSLVGFEADAGRFQFAPSAVSLPYFATFLRERFGSLHHLEEVRDAQVFQQVEDALVEVQKSDSCFFVSGLGKL